MRRWWRELVGADPAPLFAVLAAYLLSRLVFIVALGLSFDDSSLSWFWQYLDPALLRADALRSLYYLHSQPPLYNGWLALVLQLGGSDPTWLFWLGHLAAGLLLHGALYRTANLLGARPWLAAAGAILFALSPASILYESWLFYTYPVAALLIAAAPLSYFAVQGGLCSRRALAFLMVCAAVVLTRSLFHWIWFAFVAGLLLVLERERRRRVLLLAALPTLLIALVLVKNLLVFGSFGASSWLGMNLARVALAPIPAPERRDRVRAGELDPVALIAPFSPLGRYPPALREPEWMRGPGGLRHPAVAAPSKSTGAINLNHGAYVEISRRYRASALAAIVDSPRRYLGNVAHGWMIFAMPASEYWFLDRNREKMAPYERLWDAAVLGVASTFGGEDVPYDRKDPRYVRTRISYFGVAAALFGVGWASMRLFTLLRRGDRSGEVMLIGYLLGTVAFVALAGNALDFRENNRMRFVIDPMLTALFFAALSRSLARLRPRARPPAA